MLSIRKVHSVFLIAAGVLLGLLLVISNSLAQGGVWAKRAAMPSGERCFASSCELDGKIYVIGGGESSNSCMNIMEIYDPFADAWDTTKTDMPTARAELCVAAVEGKIYAIGGAVSHNGYTLGMVEVYDPSTDSWDTNRRPMPTPRKGAACGVWDNKIYVAGGTAVSGWVPSDKLEIYDPATNTWDTTKPAMPTAMYDPRGVVLNHTFYVIGGLIGSPWDGQRAVQLYDLPTDTWQMGPDLLHGRVGHTVASFNGKIYAIGGESRFIPVTNVEEYDPQKNSWEVIDELPDVMNIHCSSVFGTDIYIFGGTKCGITTLCPTDDVYSYQLTGWRLQASGTANTLWGVSLIDASTAIAVGDSGLILRTTDGGATWDSVSSGTSHYLSDVCFTNATTGWVVGDSGTILHTNDGGQTWSSRSNGVTNWLGGVCFTDATTGTVVGYPGAILRTTDGGSTWDSQSSDATVRLRDVCFTDAVTGTVVGDYGTILRTTNGGLTWSRQSSGVTCFLFGVSFADANTGTVVGGIGEQSVLHTTDGGTTWSIQSANASNLYWSDVHFIDSNQGTIVGGNAYRGDGRGEIIHTNDGGVTWVKQLVGYPAGLRSVSFSDANTGIAVGTHGTILRTTTGGAVTRIDEDPRPGETIPTCFILYQNYPNPFNPTTVVSFQLPVVSDVTLAVYDILGREVSTLVNERREAGVHQVKFDAAGLAGGVYFYRLSVAPLARRDLVPREGDVQAGSFVQTKKLMVLK